MFFTPKLCFFFQAPRAKMNQQRSRRFRASKETVEKVQEIARIRESMAKKGLNVPPEKAKGPHFDSNCITPVSFSLIIDYIQLVKINHTILHALILFFFILGYFK